MEKNFLATTKISDTPNKSRKTGEIISHTYSTVIPKAVVNKFGLDKGRQLYWDIDDSNIIITPELPEEDSITAGYDILQDMLFNGMATVYNSIISSITKDLRNSDLTKEGKINNIVEYYTNIPKQEEEAFKNVVLYLLDYPLDIPDRYEILQEAYNQITKTE